MESYCVRPSDVTPRRGGKSPDGTGLHTEGLLDEFLLGRRGEKSGFSSAKRLKIVRQTYEPGGWHNTHSHDMTEQAYYVAAGEARVTIGDETFDVGAGTLLYLPARLEHSMLNIGDGPLVNLLICAELEEDDVDEASTGDGR